MEREKVDHYGATYEGFAADVYAAVRGQAFGEDIGQTGWLTADEHDTFLSWLALGPGKELLDVACGSGGPTLRAARRTEARVRGIDLHADAVRTAKAQAERAGLAERATFEQVDAGKSLPFEDARFDGLICVDAINHLPDRGATLREWARVIEPGGRVVFTDPIVVTGPLTNEEIAIRSSIGFFLFVPPGADQRLLEEAGFDVLEAEDRTENMARMAERWQAARAAHARELRQIEGDRTFDGQQRFFRVAAKLAAERRLSRFAFCGRRKG
jgi:ubiquinone/menaquinone biosynthesis C-methylase UbiE